MSVSFVVLNLKKSCYFLHLQKHGIRAISFLLVGNMKLCALPVSLVIHCVCVCACVSSFSLQLSSLIGNVVLLPRSLIDPSCSWNHRKWPD